MGSPCYERAELFVEQMNNVRRSAEKIVLKELIYMCSVGAERNAPHS